MSGEPARVAVASAIQRPDDETSLVDLLDRVIDRGVVVQGDIVLSVAGVDLVHVGLQLVLRGVDEPGGVA